MGLLRATAALAQATFEEQGLEDEAAKRMKTMCAAALTKIEKLLWEEKVQI